MTDEVDVVGSDTSDILADQVANDASLGGSVLQILQLVKSGSVEALSELNQAYFSGILAAERLDCIDENAGAPVLEYYCGEDGIGERLTDFGYSAFAISVADDNQCRDALLNNTDANACTLNYSDSEQAGEWFVKYSLSSDSAVAVEKLTLSEGVVPEFVEFESGSPICEITITAQDNIEYSDQTTCRVAVAQVLAILQTPQF